MMILGNYNLNCLNIDNKEPLDTICTTNVTNKTICTHSKSLIDYIIINFNIKDSTKQPICFTPIKTDNLEKIFITEPKVCKKTTFKRKIIDKKLLRRKVQFKSGKINSEFSTSGVTKNQGSTFSVEI